MCLPCLCLLLDFNSFEQQRDTPVIDLDTGFYRTDYLPPNVRSLGICVLVFVLILSTMV